MLVATPRSNIPPKILRGSGGFWIRAFLALMTMKGDVIAGKVRFHEIGNSWGCVSGSHEEGGVIPRRDLYRSLHSFTTKTMAVSHSKFH